MYTKDYIQATYETIRGGSDAKVTLKALSEYLKRRGLMKLYPSILRGLLERMRRGVTGTIAKVIVARTSDLKKYGQEIQTSLKGFESTTAHETHIDETIIGGFIIESVDKRLDRSYKRTLLHTYHKVTD